MIYTTKPLVLRSYVDCMGEHSTDNYSKPVLTLKAAHEAILTFQVLFSGQKLMSILMYIYFPVREGT